MDQVYGESVEEKENDRSCYGACIPAMNCNDELM